MCDTNESSSTRERGPHGLSGSDTYGICGKTVKPAMSSRSDVNESAALVAACDAQVVIKIQPVHVSLPAAAIWQWDPAQM